MAAWNLSTAEKLVFLISLIVGSIALGYGARRVGFSERVARILSWFVIIVPYTVVSFLAIWVLRFYGRLSVLPVFGFTILAAGVGASVLLARWLGMARSRAGAFVLAAGASNLGFTMGGFVNFAIFGEQGLAVAAMYTMYWEFGMVLILYPVARHFGAGPRQPFLRLVLANFADVRSLPLLAAVAGLTLNLAGIPRPVAVAHPLVGQANIIDILIIGGAVIAFFTTGLRLHFEHLAREKLLYPIVAAVKFLLKPAVGGALIALMWLIGRPLVYPELAPAWKVLLVQASTPTAIYAVVLSNLFDLDDKLASILFVVNTSIYLAVVMPLVVFLFR